MMGTEATANKLLCQICSLLFLFPQLCYVDSLNDSNDIVIVQGTNSFGNAFISPKLSGYIVDELKNPIEGVQVEAYTASKNTNLLFGMDVKLMGRAYTDTSGKYQIEIKGSGLDGYSQFIMCFKENYAIMIGQHQSEVNQFDQVEMSSRYTSYAGIVKDLYGNPISGATVYAFLDNIGWTVIDLRFESALTSVLHTQTDVNGRFVFNNVPVKSKAEFGVLADGFTNTFTWNTEEGLINHTISAGKNDIQIVMQKAGKIVGKVVENDTNKPISNLKVYVSRVRTTPLLTVFWSPQTGTLLSHTLEQDNQEITTNTEGEFIAKDLIPGEYNLFLDPFTHAKRQWCSPKVKVIVSEDKVSEITLACSPIAKVNLHVTSQENAKPINNAQIKIIPKKMQSDWYQNILELNTDENGNVVFSLGAGDYQIDTISKKDFIYFNAGKSIFTIKPADEIVLEKKLIQVTGVWGQCLDESGNPVSDAELYIGDKETIFAKSNKDGLFSISAKAINPKDKNEILTAYHKDLKIGGILSQIPTWSAGLVKVNMTPLKTIRGRLIRTDGEAVANNTIELLMQDNSTIGSMELHPSKMYRKTMTNSDGEFSFDIITGKYLYTLQATVEGLEKLRYQINMTDSKQDIKDLGDILLRSSSYSVSGVLVDQLGYPIKGIPIRIHKDYENNQTPIVTDSSGKFQFNRIAEGNIILEANFKWDLYEQATFKAGTINNRFILENTFENGKWVYPRDTPPLDGASIEILLIDSETGHPISGKSANIQIEGNNINTFFVAPDSAGKAVFSLDSGHYSLDAEKYPEYPPTSIEIDVVKGNSYQHTITLNQRSRLQGKLSDSQGNPIEDVSFQIYPIEYYEIDHSEVLGDGSFSLTWDASQYHSDCIPYLFVIASDKEYGRVYKISPEQKSLDIILEPSAYLILEDKPELDLDITFYDTSWKNYSNLYTYLDTKTTKSEGHIKITGIYPVPEELIYEINLFDGESKQAIIKSTQINPGAEISIVQEVKSNNTDQDD